MSTLPLVSDLWLRVCRSTSYFPCSCCPLLMEPGSTSTPLQPLQTCSSTSTQPDQFSDPWPFIQRAPFSSGSPVLILQLHPTHQPASLAQQSQLQVCFYPPSSYNKSLFFFSPSKILHIFNPLHSVPAPISRCHTFSPSTLSQFLCFSTHESGSFLSSVPAGKQCHESTGWREVEAADLSSSSLPRTGQSFTCNDRSAQPQEPFTKGT